MDEATPQRRDDNPADDLDDAVVIAYSLAQPLEARLRGLRNYSRLLRELQRERDG